MKKIFICLTSIFIFCGNAYAWDLYTYPTGKDSAAATTGAPNMRAAIMYYFESEAIIVQHNAAIETDQRLAFSVHIIGGRANPNSLSRQVSTNSSIASKITAFPPRKSWHNSSRNSPG